MKKSAHDPVEQKLDTLIELMKHSLALQLAQAGMKQSVIAKHIRVANAKVTKLLQGMKKAD